MADGRLVHLQDSDTLFPVENSHRTDAQAYLGNLLSIMKSAGDTMLNIQYIVKPILSVTCQRCR